MASTTSSFCSTATDAQGSTGAARSGLTGAYTGNSLSFKITMAFFLGQGIYNAVELIFIIFFTFTRFTGLYFWSLIIASLGIILHNIGFLLKFFQLLPATSSWDYVGVVLVLVGWYAMVTGQSFVLWSRLHLLTNNHHVLKWSFWMIISGVFMYHFPTTVLLVASNSKSLSNETLRRFVHGYTIMEKAQLSGFCLQEFILSGIYIKETLSLLKLGESVKDDVDVSENSPGYRRNRKLMYQLLLINIPIIIMDCAVLGLECANLFIMEVSIKGTVYSLKLKLEFAVLSRLVKIARTRRSDSSGSVTRSTSIEQNSIHATASHTGSVLERFKSAASGRLGDGGGFNESNWPDFVNPRRLSGDPRHAESMGTETGNLTNTFAESWEERGEWTRKSRAKTGCWIDEEMDKHNIE